VKYETLTNIIAVLAIAVIVGSEGFRWHLDTVSAARIAAVQEYMKSHEVVPCPAPTPSKKK
jgi:hypothetical protein